MKDYAGGKGGRPKSLWRVAVWSGAGSLLLAPLVAMRFTEEVNWTGSDFGVLGVMMAVPLAILELTVRATSNLAYRAAMVIALGAAFLMTWVNLAVGIFGSENNPLNLLFFGVLAMGFISALIAGFKPNGMARAMIVMAMGQGLAGVAGLAAGHHEAILVGFFLAAWLTSAWLFHKAGRMQAATGA